MDKMEKAIQLLRAEFGEEWQKIVQSLGVQDLCSRCGKELTSFIAYPERGEGGSSKWRGNCSPKVVEAILKYVLDTKKYYHFKNSCRQIWCQQYSVRLESNTRLWNGKLECFKK